jgi:serine/threonine protein phosphatase PrpC
MYEAKNTQRAVVRIGYDGRVHKEFRGPKAEERFENEIRVLKYLEARKCDFVPRVLESDRDTLTMVTSNCGARVEHMSDQRMKEIFEELESYGVRHDDPFLRNITYRASDGRFCVIDFEFASIIGPEATCEPVENQRAAADAPQHIHWSGMTHPGRFRPNNEDTFLAILLDKRGVRYLGKNGDASLSEADFIFAVSDGMGGERSGEFASKIAMEKITSLLPKQFGLSEDRFLAYSDSILLELFAAIHRDMTKLGRFDENCRNMGATLTLAWFRRGHLVFGHVGDSRLYRLPAAGGIEQISDDHTHVGWLRRKGELNEREARMHPRKNVLAQALGAGHQFLRPHIGTIDYQSDDRFLLCSDGLNEGLWDRGIEELVRHSSGAADETPVAERLVMSSVAECGRDNVTAVVVRTD